MGPIITVLLLAILAYIVVGAIVNFRKLPHFPGPPLAAFSRAWLFWQSCNGRVNKKEREALRRYGSPCRIGPNLLVTDDADVVRHMNAPTSKWTRSSWYEGMKFDPRQDNVFSTRDEAVHTDMRKKEIGAYMGRDIDTLEPSIDARIEDLIYLINNSYNGISMDFSSVARYFTLDVLSTIAFGRPFGFMAANADLWDYDKANAAFMPILELSVNHRLISSIVNNPLVQRLLGPKQTDATGIGPMLAFAHTAVAERFHPTKPVVKTDMLNHFKQKGLTQIQCEAEAALQIIAGSDSTTTILRCTLYHLVGTPRAYHALRTEIDAHPKMTTYAELQSKLPYLSAVIWEGLRMYPPLFGLKAKCAPADGETIKGVFYPPGTEIALCDDAMVRNPLIFGDDAELFRPERWILADEKTRMKYKYTVDTLFASGRFLCLGRQIAFMEIFKGMVALMRNFDWAIADPMKGVPCRDHSVHLQSDMNLVATPRM